MHRRALTVTVAALSLQTAALAQNLPAMTGPQVRVGTDSGLVFNNGTTGPVVVYTTDVRAEGAAWLRLKFGEVHLSGSIEGGTASFLRITSTLDGAYQYLNAQSVEEWVHTSAYMNGDTVTVELLAFPGTGPSRVVVESVTAGEPEPFNLFDSICGPTDDRLLSFDPRNCRVSTGCSGWLINDKNNGFLTAGHCGVGAGTVMMFNVPLSTAGGGLVNPPPQHQYVVDAASIRLQTGAAAPGNDHAYYGCFKNSTTQKTAFEAQGAFYTLATSAPPVAGQTIRITGYGTTGAGVPASWNQVQKTHTGAYVSNSGGVLGYTVDTTGGNSGSPVHNLSNDTAIGIHGWAGCTSTGGFNQSSSSVSNLDLQADLANPGGVNIPTMATCYANCNKDAGLTIADFACFQAKFANGDPSANCNGDVVLAGPPAVANTWVPNLTIADFACFQTKYIAGCP